MSAHRRALVIAEANSWLGTRYHHQGRVKGAGVDCGTLLLCVFEEAGFLPHVAVENYSSDFFMHRDREWYTEIVERFADPIEGPPLPGDLALFQMGRLFAHGAIVVAWPRIIHANANLHRVHWGDATMNPLVRKRDGSPRPVRFFSPKAYRD